MKLLEVLKDIGKDLNWFGQHVQAGLKPVEQIVPLIPGGAQFAPIVAGVEGLLTSFTPAAQPGPTLTESQLAAITQTVSAAEGLKAALSPPAATAITESVTTTAAAPKPTA